jgi:hypothetical protein
MMLILTHKIMNRIHRKTIYSAAVSKRVMSPGVETTAPSSLYFPEDLDAILNVISSSTIELERNRVLGEQCFHLPTIEYELSRVRIRDEYVMSRGLIAKLPTNRPSSQRLKRGAIKEALLSTNILSGMEFGHWVRDALVTEMHGVELGLPAIGLAREPWLHEPEYRSIGDLDCLYTSEARVDRMLMLDDRGLNEYWASRFRKLRRRMRAGVEKKGESLGPMIFLERGDHGRMRDPANLDELRSGLEAMGFRSFMPTDLPVSAIGNALRDAKIVVSAEGSHLNHLHLFAPDGLILITLQDPHRFYAYHKRLIDLYGSRFGFVVGRPDPALPSRYRVNMDQLGRLVELASIRPHP